MLKKANKRRKVLLVEDDEHLIRVLKLNLRQENLEVLLAKNGEKGLKLAEKERPELILLDIVMPRMDGEKMLKEMRKSDWGKDLKVIILSNLSQLNKEGTFKKLKVKKYLIKAEIPMEDLIEIVKSELT